MSTPGATAPAVPRRRSTADLVVSTALLVAVVAPWVGLLGFAVWAVVRVVRRRLAWWTALAALLAVPALWSAGAGIVWLSVGGAGR